MPIPFVIYDPASGRILQTGMNGSVEPVLLEGDPRVLLKTDDAVDGPTNYIAAGVVTPRPACPVSASLAGKVLTLSGVPLGAVVTVRGPIDADVTQDAADGGLQLTFPAGGKYFVRCDPFPALPWETMLDL